MNSAVKPIQILVLHDTQNDAEPLINHFRVNGYATRSQFIASAEELSGMLADHEWDLILAKLETETVDVPHCLEEIKTLAIDLPIILLIEDYDISAILKGYQLGAKDVILDGEPDLLVPAALRELASLEHRRQLKSAKEQLAQSEKRVQLLLRNSKDAIAYVHDGMHIYANESYMEMFGYDDLDDLLCVPVIDIVASEFQAVLKKLLKQKGQINEHALACQCVGEDGEAFDVEMDFSSAIYDGEPCIQIIISTVEDSSAELQKQLAEISHKDMITGLYNRQYFVELLTAQYQELSDSGHYRYLGYIHIVDINDIRSAAGASGTDAVLTAAAGVIKSQISEDTIVARIADDAFAIIFNDTDQKKVVSLSERIVNAAADQLLELGGKTIQINCVLGVAMLDSHSADGHEALLEAQKASDVAVENAHKVSFFDRTDVSNIADGDLVAEIKFALENDRFLLYFQPIISLRGEEAEHYEALLRILNKEGETVSIGPYVSTILLSGQAAPVDRWVIETAIKALSKRKAKGVATRLFVHITYATISDPDFLPWVNVHLKKHNVSGSSLVFQLSEQDATDYLKPAKAFSRGLSLLKCQLSIGNFGKVADVKTLTRHLDVSFMKLDPSIVQGMDTEEGHQHLKNLINDIRGEGLASIVPHIESASLMQALWQDGAAYAQGHMLQPPTDAMDFNFSDED